MKNNIPKDTDVFKLLPDITEEETIRFLSEVSALAYKKNSSVWKYSKAMIIIAFGIYFIVCLGCIYHKEYLYLICTMMTSVIILYLYKAVDKNMKRIKLSYLFIDTKETEINSYDNTDNGFFVNFKDKTTQPVQNVQAAFLLSAYIMLVFKNNSIAIIKTDIDDKEKILDVINNMDSRIISYDRMPQNMLWMKKYYKKIIIKVLISALIFCLLFTIMKLAI